MVISVVLLTTLVGHVGSANELKTFEVGPRTWIFNITRFVVDRCSRGSRAESWDLINQLSWSLTFVEKELLIMSLIVVTTLTYSFSYVPGPKHVNWNRLTWVFRNLENFSINHRVERGDTKCSGWSNAYFSLSCVDGTGLRGL